MYNIKKIAVEELKESQSQTGPWLTRNLEPGQDTFLYTDKRAGY